MRPTLAITIVAAALGVAACGDDNSDTAQDVPDRAEQVVEQGREATERVGAEDLVAETQRLADQVAQAARELAADPDADLDGRLGDVEQRANDLADQAKSETSGQEPELASALGEVNERLSAAAAELRSAENSADVREVLERELNPAADGISKAAGELSDKDVARELEQARDEIDGLSEDLR